MSLDPASIIMGIVGRVGSIATTRMMLAWFDTLTWRTRAQRKPQSNVKHVKTRQAERVRMGVGVRGRAVESSAMTKKKRSTPS